MMRMLGVIFCTCQLLWGKPSGGVVFVSGDSPLPEKAALRGEVMAAVDEDAAADVVLRHFAKHGYPAVAVGVVDEGGVRVVEIEVMKYGDVFVSGGGKRTEEVVAGEFGDLSGEFVNEVELKERLADFHGNPFHVLVPRMQPGGDAVNVLLRAEGSRESRYKVGFHNAGASPLPRQRFWASGEWSDFGGRSSVTSLRVEGAPELNDYHALQLGVRLFGKGGGEWAVYAGYSGAGGQDVGGVDSFDAYTWQAGGGLENEA